MLAAPSQSGCIPPATTTPLGQLHGAIGERAPPIVGGTG